MGLRHRRIRAGRIGRPQASARPLRARLGVLAGAAALGAAAVVPLGAGAGQAGAAPRSSARPLAKNPLHLVTPGYLEVVAQPDQLPFDGIENHREVGFCIALIGAVAKQLHLKVSIHDQDLSTLLTALSAHEYDVAAVAMLETPAREQDALFSQPFYYGGVSVLVKKSSGLSTISSFAGKSIGVLAGSTQAQQAVQYLGSSVQIVTFPTENNAVQALEGGSVDAVFIGYANTVPFIQQYPDLTVPLYWILPTPNGFAVALGDTKLANAIDKAEDVLYKNGTYAQLYHKWLPGNISQLLIKAHPGFKSPKASNGSAKKTSKKDSKKKRS